jgi:hypothetical protein
MNVFNSYWLNKPTIGVFILFVLLLTSCESESRPSEQGGDTTKRVQSPALPKSSNPYYPFELQEFNGVYNIVANIEREDLYPRYYNLFKRDGYEGNGYCWEGHIRQILEKLDKSLLARIEFDPEGGAFFAIANSKESQRKFVELLSPIFSDTNKLEEWVKKADRTRIDD